MALLKADEDDSNQVKGMNQPATPQGQPTQGAAESVAVSGSPSQAPGTATPTSASQQSANPKASSGTFTNLRQYISANQGNKVAGSATQKVGTVAAGAKQAIGQGQEAFGQRVEEGSLANRGNAVSDISNIVQQARGVTAKPQATPASAPQTTPTTAAAPAEASPATPPSYTEGLDTKRFQDVINAQYKGPESLRQSGLYDPISGKVQEAQTKIGQTQTATGRENLLKDIFSKNRQYTTGQNKLDALLLNTSKEGVQSLVEKGRQAGDLQQQLQQAENVSQNLATNRAGEIQGIQQQARTAFGEGQTAERAATDERLASVVKDWDKLPEHFKQIIRDNPKGALNLGQQEADVLGIGAGEGLYNLGENAIKTNLADKSKLISRDEQARQFALSQLAGLDTSKALDTNVKYSDVGQAGTQTAMSALDTAGTRAALNEAQKQFKESAESANLVGEGRKKVSRGNLFGKKTKTYEAQVQGNVADMLRQGGYDVSDQTTSQLTNQDLLNNYLKSTSTTRNDNIDQEEANRMLAGGATGAATGASIGSVVPVVGTAAGAIIGGTLGMGASGGSYVDNLQNMTDILDGYSPGVGKAIQDARSGVGNVVGSVLGKDIGGAIGGINSSKMKAFGSSIAKEKAIKDLQSKYQNYLEGQGFQNRANIVDNQDTQTRTAALRDLLARMDKTNV